MLWNYKHEIHEHEGFKAFFHLKHLNHLSFQQKIPTNSGSFHEDSHKGGQHLTNLAREWDRVMVYGRKTSKNESERKHPENDFGNSFNNLKRKR